jgi:radical SAM protein with 4Fe4S-binding SPASM domain
MVIRDLPYLREVVEHLISMKHAGYPILNPEASLREFVSFFEGVPPRSSPCLIGLRNLFVSAAGEMRPCHRYGVSLGNIQRDDIGEVWPSEAGRKLRRELVACPRFCLGTCIIKRKPSDYARLAAQYL